MVREFKLPDLGEGIHEGEILKVIVSVGDEVKEGDPILEVDTDKAAVEIPSPYTGKVKEIRVKEGDMVHVGDVLITFEGGEAEEPKEKPEAARKEKPGEKPKVEEERAPAGPAEGGPVPASPATRRLARELGVDLQKVPPSGPGGLVTMEDVKAFAGQAKEEKPKPEPGKPAEARPLEIKGPKLPDFTKWGKVERQPLRSIRRATAKQMTLAWSQIPHVHNQDRVDMTKLQEFRSKHKEEVEAKGGRLTITAFALKAAASALRQFPRVNSSLDTETGEIVLKQYYHIGVAVSTDEGLVVPVIRDVDRKSITELAVELTDLVKRTRERKVSLDELQGGTFTVTNVGPMGGGYFAPIINYPEVAILGLGAMRMEAVAMEESGERYEIVTRLMMPIVLCVDHRVLDGVDAIAFMKFLAVALEDPERLLMNIT
jgi:pyruvate dehydrogenase E2 component (dihydrolipoamide acetyltransferase)